MTTAGPPGAARRLLGAPTALIASALLLAAGCGNPSQPVATAAASAASAPSAGAKPTNASVASTAAKSAVGRVVLNTGSSTVTIRGSEASGYTVRRTVRGTTATPADSFRQDGDTLVLDGCDLPGCWFDYDVTVPRGATLTGTAGSGGVDVADLVGVDLETASGAVAASGISGPVTVRSSSGAVRLTDVDGDVRLRTSSGSVQGAGLRGTRTDVATTSGSVELTTATVQTVTVESTSGAIRVAVAPGRYHVADRPGGPARIEIPDDPAASAAVDVASRTGGVTVGLAG